MADNSKAQRVVKANDALRKAKDLEQKKGIPVPQYLRDELREAVKDYEKSK